jgi:C4-dicarboxylate-specific signal transduction histidine kinase
MTSPSAPPVFVIDDDADLRASMNLIMNSIDAIKEVDQPRVISIRSQSAEDQQLKISVSDTDVGLPPQQNGQDI